MYGFRSVLDKQPVTIAAAIMAWANLIVIAGWVTLDPKAISGLNIALVLTLGLFVNSKTANVSVLHDIAEGPASVGLKKPRR